MIDQKISMPEQHGQLNRVVNVQMNSLLNGRQFSVQSRVEEEQPDYKAAS